MHSHGRDEAQQIFDALVNGRESERAQAVRALEASIPNLNRGQLRRLLLKALTTEFAAFSGQEDDVDAGSWVRSWLLSALTRIAGDDEPARQLLRAHLDPEQESHPWVRHWVLKGLIMTRPDDLPELLRSAIKDRDPLVRKLAVAVLARDGDPHAMNELETGLKQTDSPEQSATLRALRTVPIPALSRLLCEILQGDRVDDATYDAIVALGKIPPTSRYAAMTARTLADFVVEHRRSPMRESMRIRALAGLGTLAVDNTAPVLVEELLDDNPAVVREAARALESTLGTALATSRVLEAATRESTGVDRLQRYADALRWMQRDVVVEQLEEHLVSSPQEVHFIVERLMSEVGGSLAFQKLRARTSVLEQYTTLLGATEDRVRTLFEGSLHEARNGFRTAMFMDIAVFFMGIGLILCSGGLVIYRGGDLSAWAGVSAGAAASTGVLGVLYTLLVARPRDRIRDTVDHLMTLKILFLGYLRQLHQVDQMYARRLLEDRTMDPGEMGAFSVLVRQTMDAALSWLGTAEANQAREAGEAAAAVSSPRDGGVDSGLRTPRGGDLSPGPSPLTGGASRP